MELYINDRRVDLDRTVPFPLTYQIADIKDLSTRKGSSSKTIKLPGSQTNSEIMSTVFSLTTTDVAGSSVIANFDPSQKATARYYQNGVLQFEGICKLNDCIKRNGVWSFNIVLFAEQIDVVGLLKNYKLKELGWSEYNHDFTQANQVNSWSGVIQKNGSNYNGFTGSLWNGEGYYYGLIDYGFDRASPNHFEVDQIPLQVFVKTIVDKMFAKIDVEVESDFFDSQQFKKLLLAYEGGVYPSISEANAIETSIETDQINPDGGFILNQSVGMYQNGSTGIWSPLTGNFFSDYTSDSGTVVDPSGQIQSNEPFKFVASAEGDYNLNYKGSHDINIDFSISNSSGSPLLNVYLKSWARIKKNGIIYQNGLIWENNLVDITTLSNSFTANFDFLFDLNLQVSDVIEVEIYFQSFSVEVNDTGATSIQYDYDVTSVGCELDINYEVQQIQPGSNINIKQFLPDMDCFTFFKGLVTMFNLYTKPTPETPNKLKIDPLNSFYNGSNNAVDWSSLLDPSEDITITPTVNFASKEYSFEFANDKDYFNERYIEDVTKQYGSKVVVSGSQFSKGETKLKLPFSNKILGEIPDTNLIVPRNFQVKTDTDGVSEIVQKRGKPFIVQVKAGAVGTLQSGDWNHVSESLTTTARTEYPYVGHLDDIDSPSFDLQFEIPSFVYYNVPTGINYTTNNLYGFHEKFIKELVDRNGKMLSASFRLNEDIINRLDFGDLVNVDGVVYRLQKVSEYNSSDDNSTKSELIRLIEGEGIQTYTIEVPFDEYETPSKFSKRETEGGIKRITEDDDQRVIE